MPTSDVTLFTSQEGRSAAAGVLEARVHRDRYCIVSSDTSCISLNVYLIYTVVPNN